MMQLGSLYTRQSLSGNGNKQAYLLTAYIIAPWVVYRVQLQHVAERAQWENAMFTSLIADKDPIQLKFPISPELILYIRGEKAIALEPVQGNYHKGFSWK